MQGNPAFERPYIFVSTLLAQWLDERWVPSLSRLILVVTALLLAVIAYYVARAWIAQRISVLTEKTTTQWDDVLASRHFFVRLSHLVPAIVLYLLTPFLVLGPEFSDFAQRLTLAYMVIAGTFAIFAFLTALRDIYETSFEGAAQRPIRSYLQVIEVILVAMAAIFVVALVLGRSPWALIAGLGTMSVILLLVFKDSILGLVASIKLTANDMVRIGDWIEMPQFGADGNVIEILLTTVKVRNWDNTIVTIPSYRLISEAFKNWRGMSESGVRRIKRSILIDMNSVRFVDDELLARLKKIQYIQEYLDRKLDEINLWNNEKQVDESSLVNGRHLTNLGTFRAYLEAYLRNHPQMNQDHTVIAHYLHMTEKGLPVEIFVFCNEQRWKFIEAITADLFDHFLAVVQEFDLHVAQVPTGSDVRDLIPLDREV